MNDFVAEGSNLSTAEPPARPSSRLNALCEGSRQSSLSSLEATLWVAETGAGSAGAALEMARLARQTHEQSLSLFRKVTAAR